MDIPNVRQLTNAWRIKLRVPQIGTKPGTCARNNYRNSSSIPVPVTELFARKVPTYVDNYSHQISPVDIHILSYIYIQYLHVKANKQHYHSLLSFPFLSSRSRQKLNPIRKLPSNA